MRTRLLVAADGSRSRVRALAEGDWICGAYGQYAVVANVCLDEEVTAGYQRFVSTGPVALLPVATEDTLAPMGNVIWSTTQAEARGLVECSDGQFVDEVNAALCGSDDDGDAYEVPGVLKKGLHMWRGKRGDVVALPPRAVGVKGKRGWFPLMQGHAGRYVYAEKRSVVVGDAGHAVHPMAGQGVNMGYADVEALAGCIVGGASVGRDVGGEGGAVLAAYERERMIRNMGVLGVLGGLHTVFGSQRIAEWRRFGMGILDASPVVKKLLMRAMR